MGNSQAKAKAWQKAHRKRIATGFDRVMLYEFDLLEEHRRFVEQHFAHTISKFEKKFEEELSDWDDPDDRAAYEDHLSDEFHRLSSDLPRLQWYAQFLVAYATIENSLNELCRIVQRRSKQQLSFKDLAGQGIVRAANYLSRVFGVEAPFKTAHWQKALLLGEIRNTIAHRGGVIEYDLSKRNSLAYRIHKIPGIELKQVFAGAEDAEVILSAQFLRDALASLRKVVSDVANYELYEGDES